MLKTTIAILLFTLCFNTYCKDIPVISIGKKTITEKDISPPEAMIVNVFKNKYGREPQDIDGKAIENIRYFLRSLKLKDKVYKIIMETIREKYYNKVVTQEIIKEHMKKNESYIAHRIKRTIAYLKAFDYIKNSKEKDKYQIAYDKYLKKGHFGTLKFFRSCCGKDYYIDFLKKQLEEDKNNIMSEPEKETLFQENLPAFVYKMLADKDKKVAEHLKLCDEQKCNYKTVLFMNWILDETKKAGCKIYSDKYGDLQKIMQPPVGLLPSLGLVD